MSSEALHYGTFLAAFASRAMTSGALFSLLAVAHLVLGASARGETGVASGPPEGATEGAPLPPAPPGRSDEAEVHACRVACHDERWDPVCHEGHTFANACWVRCAAGAGAGAGAGADADEPTRGRCDSLPDAACMHACLDDFRDAEGDRARFAWRPACGADGITYTTACFATCSGVRSVSGECHAAGEETRR